MSDTDAKPREWESIRDAAKMLNALARAAREEGFDITFNIYGDGELGQRGEIISVHAHNYGLAAGDALVATTEAPLDHRGLHAERTTYDLLERAFAEQWQRDNESSAIVRPTLLSLMQHRGKTGESRSPFYAPAFRIDQRDATIVATVIQWLGSNIGRNFLDRSLACVGVRIEWKYAQLRAPGSGPMNANTKP